MRRPMLLLVGLFTLAVLCLVTGCPKDDPDHLPKVRFVPLPKQTPVPLNVSTVDKFVEWVATMPASQIDDVKNQIALVKSDPAVVDAVAGRLSFTNPGSYGHQLIYLSILGQMKNDRAVAPLNNYLNSPQCPVFEEHARFRLPPGGPPKTSVFDACAGLKSAAVNMIAFVNSDIANGLVLQAASAHPSRAVRLSAINAYLYNNGDSAEAIATIRQHVRPDELKYVGIPRLSPATSEKEFQERLARFYAQYPEERPPQPRQIAHKFRRKGHPDRVSVTPSSRTR